MSAQITIQIVGWNSEEHLRGAAGALSGIPEDDVVIRYIDNGSSDGSVSVIREILPHADIIELGENKGFTGAHNIGFLRCDTPYVLTHDPDVELVWENVLKLLSAFDDASVGAVQGKLLRKSNDVIDSAGVVSTLTFNGKERGAGEKDTGQFEEKTELLAVTGACGLYRMSALREIAHGEREYFDADFFAYKEDIDLGWRLLRAGYASLYIPLVVGRHVRTLGKRGNVPWYVNPFRIYTRLKRERTRYSLRNYIWMLFKNMTVSEVVTRGVFVLARLGYFFLLTLLYPPLFSAWGEALRKIPSMIQKRVI